MATFEDFLRAVGFIGRYESLKDDQKLLKVSGFVEWS